MSLKGTQQCPLVYISSVAACEQLRHCQRDTQLIWSLNLQSLTYIYYILPGLLSETFANPSYKAMPSSKTMIMKMFFIYTVQRGSHWPHVATDSQDLRFMGVLTPLWLFTPWTFCPDASLEKPVNQLPVNQHKSLSNFCKTPLGFSIWLLKSQKVHYKAFQFPKFNLPGKQLLAMDIFLWDSTVF